MLNWSVELLIGLLLIMDNFFTSHLSNNSAVDSWGCQSTLGIWWLLHVWGIQQLLTWTDPPPPCVNSFLIPWVWTKTDIFYPLLPLSCPRSYWMAPLVILILLHRLLIYSLLFGSYKGESTLILSGLIWYRYSCIHTSPMWQHLRMQKFSSHFNFFRQYKATVRWSSPVSSIQKSKWELLSSKIINWEACKTNSGWKSKIFSAIPNSKSSRHWGKLYPLVDTFSPIKDKGQ